MCESFMNERYGGRLMRSLMLVWSYNITAAPASSLECSPGYKETELEILEQVFVVV